MANYNKPKITEEDMELFHSINRYGFVDIQYTTSKIKPNTYLQIKWNVVY